MIKIQRGSDPFKKYWWVLLLVFGVGGGAVCLPGLSGGGADGVSGGSEGGAAAVGEDGVRTVDGSSASLDPVVAMPGGAPGGALNLSMDGAGGRKSGDMPSVSSLYQAPEDETAANAATAGAAGGTATAGVSSAASAKRGLADALRSISRRSSASADPTGWGGQKPQRGFTAPKGNFGGLSGIGGGSSASGARFNADAGAAGGGFGSSSQQRVGLTSTRGLRDDGSGDASTNVRSFNNLKAVNKAMNNAARTGDLAAAMQFGGRSFDGGGAGGRVAMNSRGQADGAVGANVVSAPANLKVNDPEANSFKFTPVPNSAMPSVDPDAEKKRMQQMILQALVMGVMGMALGGAGAMLAGPMMMMMQQSQAQQAQSQQNANTTQQNFATGR